MNKDIQIFMDAFPKELKSDIESIFEILRFSARLYSSDTFDIQIGEETIYIPERIYHEDPNETEEIQMTQYQRQILNCFFTRHHNGYVRQKRLRRMFSNGNIEKWMIPYILRLTGEYVEEIINDIYVNIQLIDIDNFKEFINENKHFTKITEDRIVSYWNEYYRKYINQDKYVGFKIKTHINSLRG